jgi:F-type H+-transporting ATPase subunit b
VSNARDEAERLAREAQEKMADFVKRRTATAEAKIAQAEVQASAEVRAAAVDAAIKASERVLRDEITGTTAASFVTASLNDVRTKLQ